MEHENIGQHRFHWSVWLTNKIKIWSEKCPGVCKYPSKAMSAIEADISDESPDDKPWVWCQAVLRHLYIRFLAMVWIIKNESNTIQYDWNIIFNWYQMNCFSRYHHWSINTSFLHYNVKQAPKWINNNSIWFQYLCFWYQVHRHHAFKVALEETNLNEFMRRKKTKWILNMVHKYVRMFKH